jgi:hypothetical protein
MILLRDGAHPSAVAALLPEVRSRVFASSGGVTVESALPPRLRDTAIRIDTTLPHDEIRVVPIPPQGVITGVEVVVGPGAHPTDVGLHSGEIDRIRRWTGRVGEARATLARLGERIGLQLVTPADRTRFEAAGELRKLGPIIEERIRRFAMAGDPRTAAAIEAQTLHLLAQQERARRILSGELVAEPRGYIAQEGMPVTTVTEPAAAAPDAAQEIRRLRERQPRLDAALESAESRPARIDAGVEQMKAQLKDRLEQFAERVPRYAWLAELDLDSTADRQRLVDQLAKWPAGEGARRPGEVVVADDLRTALQALDTARAQAPLLHERAKTELAQVRAEHAQAAAAMGHWSTQVKFQADVPISPRLPEPMAGWGWRPALLEKGTLAQQRSHLHGYQTELYLANHVADHLGETVVKYGAPNKGEGRHGSDVISVDQHGEVSLWDAKYLGDGSPHAGSTTFEGNPLANAIMEARTAVSAEVSGSYSQAMREKAMANMRDGNFTAYTVSSGDTQSFHSCKKLVFRDHVLVSTTDVPVPWGTGR